MFDRLSAFFHRSVTILWARILFVLGVLGTFLLDPAASDHVTTLLRAVLDDPRHVSLALAGIGVITELARSRSLRK